MLSVIEAQVEGLWADEKKFHDHPHTFSCFEEKHLGIPVMPMSSADGTFLIPK